LGFIGPKSEAEDIKTALGAFLKDELRLDLSESKTLITHARTEHARFLGYAISIYHEDSKLSARTGTLVKTRGINGGVRLGIPFGLMDELVKRYQQRGKPIHDARLLEHSDAHIINTYQLRFRGIAEYYKYAVDRRYLAKLKNVMQSALTKTLANKHRTSVVRIYRKYRGTRLVNGETYRTLQVEIPTAKGTQCFYWGAIPLKVVKLGAEPMDDAIQKYLRAAPTRTDLSQRLLAQTCELCGSHEDCEVHHIRKLADLKTRWRGRKEKPAWVTAMIALRRKTLIVCHRCHTDIHAGRATPKKSK
jgi:hypothetical protein